MTDKLRAAARAALEALELSWASRESAKKSHEAMQLLRAALAEQEDAEHGKCRHQWMRVGLDPYASARCINCGTFKDVRPPRREWVSLTQEEIEAAWKSCDPQRLLPSFAAAIEAALREKNHV